MNFGSVTAAARVDAHVVVFIRCSGLARVSQGYSDYRTPLFRARQNEYSRFYSSTSTWYRRPSSYAKTNYSTLSLISLYWPPTTCFSFSFFILARANKPVTKLFRRRATLGGFSSGTGISSALVGGVISPPTAADVLIFDSDCHFSVSISSLVIWAWDCSVPGLP